MPDNPSMAPLLETLLEHVAPPPTEPLNGGCMAPRPALQVHGTSPCCWHLLVLEFCRCFCIPPPHGDNQCVLLQLLHLVLGSS